MSRAELKAAEKLAEEVRWLLEKMDNAGITNRDLRGLMPSVCRVEDALKAYDAVAGGKARPAWVGGDYFYENNQMRGGTDGEHRPTRTAAESDDGGPSGSGMASDRL